MKVAAFMQSKALELTKAHGGDFSRASAAAREIYQDHYKLWVAAGRTEKPKVTALANGWDGPLVSRVSLPVKTTADVAGDSANLAKLQSKILDDVRARQIMDPRLSYTQAWAQSKLLHPDWHAELATGGSGKRPPTRLSAIENSSTTAGPGNNVLLGLPTDASQEEFDTAYKANGNVFTPFSPGKVFDALVELQGKGGVDREAAMEAAKQRFSDLWKRVEALAQ